MRAVFDTNILIDYLNGIPAAAQEFAQYSQKLISIITYMEVLAGTRSLAEENATKAFLSNFELIPISKPIAERTIQLRKQHQRKLPDAIIYATAKIENCLLVTRNTKDFDPSHPDIRLPYKV